MPCRFCSVCLARWRGGGARSRIVHAAPAATHDDPAFSISDLFALYRTSRFVVYGVSVLGSLALGVFCIHRCVCVRARGTRARCCCTRLCVCVGALCHVCVGAQDGAAAEGVRRGVAPVPSDHEVSSVCASGRVRRDGARHESALPSLRFSYACISGIAGAQSVLFAKSLVSLVVDTASGGQLFLVRPETYGIAGGMTTTIGLQIYWLNCGLARWDALYNVPVFQVCSLAWRAVCLCVCVSVCESVRSRARVLRITCFPVLPLRHAWMRVCRRSGF